MKKSWCICCSLLVIWLNFNLCYVAPSSSGLSDAPPVEKKYKPLNTTPNSAKEIKVKLIPPQRKYTILGFYAHNDVI